MSAIYLSPHFSLDEATRSETASERWIDNTPTADQIANMVKAATCLEAVRSYLAQPITVDSWFRSPALNAAVGGVHNSAHLDGYAIDFVCPSFGDPESIVKFIINTGLKFDQCIQEGHWVHISFAPAMRQQVLSAHFVPGKTTTYTSGITAAHEASGGMVA